MRNRFFSIMVFLFFSVPGFTQLPYQNPALPDDKRIDDLISRLSISEKSSLMLYNSPAIERFGIQEYNWWNECLHGVGRAGKATVFPQAIALAATFDDSLAYRVATAISDEARAKHNAAIRKGNRRQYTGLSFWTPNINIFRDPRWGRGQETYGEDPYLTSRMGAAFVKGLQGDDPYYLKVSACAKHFVVHSGPEKTRHMFNALPNDRDFRETYLPAFRACIDAGVESVMCAYNRVYDEPCCGSAFLLTGLLRDAWGFKGHIVSDCWALDDIWLRHKTVATRAEAAAMAAKAGVSLNCGYIYQYLPEAVEKGLVEEATIDQDLKYLLKTRARLGLLFPDKNSPFDTISPLRVNSDAHQKLAYETAAKSIVLLKNNGVLPLDKEKLKNLFVVGPTAGDMNALLGNYNGISGHMVTFLEGIIDRVDAGTVVESNQGYLYNNDTLFQGFWQASGADFVIACVGLTSLFEGEEGEAMYNPEGGDRSNIELPRNQVKFLQLMREKIKDKPLIVIVTGGSAIALTEILNIADAILFAWYPGEQGGNALADILFGKVNPSGRLPVTFYRSTNDLPPFENYSMDKRTYRYFHGKSLYPFGYGLSYTTFAYDILTTDKPTYSTEDTVNLKISVSNSGKNDGEEVVQVYIRDMKASVPVPIHSLKGFRRVFLPAGTTKTIKIQIPVRELAYWVPDKKVFEVEKGKFIIQVGASSSDIRMESIIDVK